MSFYPASVALTIPLYSYDVVALEIEAERTGKTRDQLLVEAVKKYVMEVHEKHTREERESEQMGGEA